MENYVKTGVKMYFWSLLTEVEITFLIVGMMMLFAGHSFFGVLALAFTPVGTIVNVLMIALAFIITDDGSDIKESMVMYAITFVLSILVGNFMAVAIASLIAYVVCYHIVKYKGVE